MNKQCTRITIESESGYFCRKRKRDKLVITRQSVIYDCHIENRITKEKEENIFPIKRLLGEKDAKNIEALFSFAEKVTFKEQYPNVLDGALIKVSLTFKNNRSINVHTFYGGGIDKCYGELFQLLELVRPLVSIEIESLDYFMEDEINGET